MADSTTITKCWNVNINRHRIENQRFSNLIDIVSGLAIDELKESENAANSHPIGFGVY